MEVVNMENLNIKHLFSGELTPLNLGYMSLSAALYTAHHIQDDTEQTMVVFNIEKTYFMTTRIMGVTVFFDLDKETGDLKIIQNIEDRLLDMSEVYDSNLATVKVFKDVELYDEDIVNILTPIDKLDAFEFYLNGMIESYENKDKEYPKLEATETENELNEDFRYDEVQFQNLEAFDDQEELVLDVENEKVAEILEDLMDIDDEITELKEIAKGMLEEADFISKNGYAPEDDEYYWDDKFTDDDFYWDTTVEEDEELGISKEDKKEEKEVSEMDNNYSTTDAEFNERLDNMLEYMLTQSSVGHEPNYTFKYTKKGEKQVVPKFSDKFGHFLIDGVTNKTVFSAEEHIINLRVTRKSIETGIVETTLEPSELMSDFTVSEIISEIHYNSSKLPNTEVELYNVETVHGKVIWKAHNKK